MKSLTVNPISCRSRIAKFGLTVFTLSLSGAIAVAQQEKNAKATATPDRAATPKPSPTPETKIDAKTEAELLQAEDRFIIAIRNRDARGLSDLLADYYADSFRDDERAINKRGSIKRASEGKLSIYLIEKERKLIRSGDTFTVKGLAKKAKLLPSEETPKEEWVHVRRLWLRQGDRWLAIAQIITRLEEDELREKSTPVAKEKQPH